MNHKYRFLGLLFLAGCASIDKSCSSCNSESFGGDWLIVQYTPQGQTNCWKESNVSVSNEGQSDGIYWQSRTGHLIHIAGAYTRIQVQKGDFAGAAKGMGIDLARCKGGKYETAVLDGGT